MVEGNMSKFEDQNSFFICSVENSFLNIYIATPDLSLFARD